VVPDGYRAADGGSRLVDHHPQEIAAELYLSANTVKDFPGPARRPRCSFMSEKKSRRPFGKIKFFYPNGRW
jgi:hypothetical protein